MVSTIISSRHIDTKILCPFDFERVLNSRMAGNLPPEPTKPLGRPETLLKAEVDGF